MVLKQHSLLHFFQTVRHPDASKEPSHGIAHPHSPDAEPVSQTPSPTLVSQAHATPSVGPQGLQGRSEDRSEVSQDQSKVSQDQSKVSQDQSKVSQDRSKVSQDRPEASHTSSIVSLHEHAICRPVSPVDIPALRSILSALLPVAYPESFYRSITHPDHSARFSRVLVWTDGKPTVVGAIICRVTTDLDPSPSTPSAPSMAQSVSPMDQPQFLYLQALVLLAPYRHLGLMDQTLGHILAAAHAAPDLNIRSVYAHVWTANDEALHWYTQRGFSRDPEPLLRYYWKLQPDSAYLVRRPVPNTRPKVSAPTDSTPNYRSGDNNSGDVDNTSANVPDIVTCTAPNPSNQPPSATAPPPPPRSTSFQQLKPEVEWNDVPLDLLTKTTSSTSSKKKRRAYA